jgi:hypothetical protein
MGWPGNLMTKNENYKVMSKEKQGFFSKRDLGGVDPNEFHWELKYHNLKRKYDDMLNEMQRHLPVLEELERTISWWDCLTQGTGIATLNGYRNAIKKATE